MTYNIKRNFSNEDALDLVRYCVGLAFENGNINYEEVTEVAKFLRAVEVVFD